MATRGPPGPVVPSVSSPRYLALGLGSCHRRASKLATSNPMLWRVPPYSDPGLPRPTINQSTTGSPGKGWALLALGSAFALAALGGRFGGGPLLGLLGGFALGHQLGLLLDLFFDLELELGRRDRDHDRLGIVGQCHAARRRERIERDRVADLHAGDVVVDGV